MKPATALFAPRKLLMSLALSAITVVALSSAFAPAAEAARCLKRLGREANYVICPNGDGTVTVTRIPSRITGR